MQRRQQVGCGLITLRDGRGWVALDKTLDAEILGDQESGVEVGVRSECLFIGVERKSSAHGQSDKNDPYRKSRLSAVAVMSQSIWVVDWTART